MAVVLRNTFTLLVAVYSTLFAGLAFAQTGDPSLQLNLTLYGKAVDESFNRGHRLGAELQTSLVHSFIPVFEFKGRLRFKAEVGGNQAAFTNDYAPRQEIALREAKLQWRPLDFLNFQVGAIDQDDWGARILLDDQAFPGVRETVRLPIADFYLEFGAQQALANTPNVTFGAPVTNQGYPVYFMERVELGWQINQAKVEAHAAHFSFQKLPTSSAYASRFYGNTIVGINQTNSAYGYSFYGFQGGLSAGVEVAKWIQPRVSAEALVNDGAPRDRARSYLLSLTNHMDVSSSLRISPRGFLFALGEDASPSLYTPSDWGHNNRKGYGVGLRAELPKDKLEFGAEALVAPTISSSSYQSDWTYFTVYFRSHYDVL